MVIVQSSSVFVDSLRERLVPLLGEWDRNARLVDVEPLTGGASSLTYTVTLRGVPADLERIVLKVAPPSLEPVKNRDVLRQARLLRALNSVDGVPVPLVLFSATGTGLDSPPFFAMKFVEGECIEPNLKPVGSRPPSADVRQRHLNAARALGAMHSVAPADIGLGNEPVVTLREEIDRWTKALHTVPRDLVGEFEKCQRALENTVPAMMPAVITHGDFRLGNTLCAGTDVKAIIDFEIWSVGDPRIDLTWFSFFTDEAAHPGAEDGETGSPGIEELLSTYTADRGTELVDMTWFIALTLYKEAATTGLIVKRLLKSGVDLDPVKMRMRRALPKLLADAEELALSTSR
jgi:aminoglycoside phosphotransferase (APT) family kinase protein